MQWRGIMEGYMSRDRIDWQQCSVVEMVPGRCSGRPVVRNTRLLVDCILDNFDDGLEPKEIAEIFNVPVEPVYAILEFRQQQLGDPD
jgi:uncharacterized protein (DUF433 family)